MRVRFEIRTAANVSVIPHGGHYELSKLVGQ